MTRRSFCYGVLYCALISCTTGQMTNQQSVLNKEEFSMQRVNYQARLEPIDGILHGAGQDPDGFRDYAAAVGEALHPVMFMTYIGLTGSPESIATWGSRLKADLDAMPADVMSQVGLSMVGGRDDGSGLDDAVDRGEYDEQIETFLQALQDLGRPAFVRIGYEFEGSWNNYQPESYKGVFKKLTGLFRARDLNVATVWCSAGGSGGFMSIEELLAYYPGDEWVDWWGVDLFSAEELTDKRIDLFMQAAAAHKKPVMIGEATPRYVGVLEGEVSWDKWFAPYFELVYRYPQVKAHSYINWEWTHWSDALGFSWHDWGDARIEKNEFVKAAYIAEMQKAIWVHAVGESGN